MYIKHTQFGFTLIEMIVSLAVFSIVITVSVGALLALVATNEQLQGEQSVMTNLSFALDSMTREIRTGTNYYCYTANNFNGGGNIYNGAANLDTLVGDLTQDCSNGRNGNQRLHGLTFIEGGDSITEGSDRILYYHDSDVGQIFRKVGSDAAESIVSSGIFITDMDIFVTGSRPQSAGGANSREQALVTMYIEAIEADSATPDKTYTIQTSVVQRTLDI